METREGRPNKQGLLSGVGTDACTKKGGYRQGNDWYGGREDAYDASTSQGRPTRQTNICRHHSCQNLSRAPHPNIHTVKHNQRDGRTCRIPAAVYVYGMALVCPGRLAGHCLGGEMEFSGQKNHLLAPGGRVFISRRGCRRGHGSCSRLDGEMCNMCSSKLDGD